MDIQPVTETSQRVTDTRVLATLGASNIDPDFVEFHDYDASRPYAKMYVDRKSDTRIQVVSGLPMARMTDGSRLVPGFEATGGRYWFRNNLFDGWVDGDGSIAISAVNDQPDGRLAGKDILWTPVLYVGKEAVAPGPVRLLETDPVNENYHENVLEWDYGKFCTRRIRVIEGRFRGSWIFTGDPGADVMIDYGAAGQTLRLGRARNERGDIVDIEVKDKTVEFIPRAVAAKGVTVGDSATFYPDAHTETATVDGHVSQSDYSTGISWATIIAAAGDGYADSDVNLNLLLIQAYGEGETADRWINNGRAILLFNTNTITVGSTISGATMAIYGNCKADTLGITPDSCIYSSTPASNTALASGDYDALGNTEFSDKITYANWKTTTPFWNTYTLITAGLAAITKGGITKLGMRNANYDVAATPPAWAATYGPSIVRGYSSDQGAGYKPTLTVTYALPAAVSMGAQLINMNHLGVTTFRAGNVRAN